VRAREWLWKHVGVNGFDGGSGGGGGHSDKKDEQGMGGNSDVKNRSVSFKGVQFTSYGNNGGNGRPGTSLGIPTHSGGGGGGAGAIGENAILFRGGGDGGKGVNLSDKFTSAYGDYGYYGGGGGGMTYRTVGRQGNGGIGGGGNGGHEPGVKAQNGKASTGGGGGGGLHAKTASAGNGGSGIVIINIKEYIMETQTDAYNAEIQQCITEGRFRTGASGDVICEPFANYNENSIEHFKSLKLQPDGYKDGMCGGYVFLEKGKSYKNFSVKFSTIQSVKINILNSNICPIGEHEIDEENPIADTKKNLVNFTPSKSGFYRFNCKFFINSIDNVDIESYIEVNCDGINLMDYMYNGDLWPSTWNSSGNSNIRKIYLFNSYLRDIKLINNDIASLNVLKEYLNNQTNDMFNYNYWNNLLIDNRSKQSQIYLLVDDKRCNYQQPYISNNANFVSNCDKIKELNKFYKEFETSLESDNINYLFRHKTFVKPTFKIADSELAFTDKEGKNIKNYITYEKKDNIKERTQKSIVGDYYNYFEDEETQKSIYVLQSS